MRICGTSDVLYKCFKTKILEKNNRAQSSFIFPCFKSLRTVEELHDNHPVG